MRKNHPKPTTHRNYNKASEVDVNELAEKWVEMMVEMLLAKDKEGLQVGKIFPKLDSA